ncbi:unnamed protein product [Nippostrongylus brasiliensis]|uniref:SGNH domain-containing protein n=1 Tax=Nippostrongylus brasiliensis TaxID=27835 RepID=A0A158QZS7_NIPBR|nr:hypothetical protein Q1695_016337 [Nippostrongylus brasiliensis]VDL74206.1 unnamed protein product [Nippostrongylus brasiliensis]
MIVVRLLILSQFVLTSANSDDYRFVDEFALDPMPNYTFINKSDAAWNVTLMRYLNFKENNFTRNMDSTVCIRLSNRFAPTSKPPYGFCEAEKGLGLNNVLVWGDELAMNLGRTLYYEFRKHAREFNIFSIEGCDPMLTERRPEFCKTEVNYTDILQTLRPDVIFVLSRSAVDREDFNETKSVDSDRVYQEQLKRLKEMERIAKKVYILQALPSLNTDKYPLLYTVTPVRKLKDRLIKKDDKFARRRIKELRRKCRKCELIDIKPALLDHKQRYCGFDQDTNLMYIDQRDLFTRSGRGRIRGVFAKVAKEFKV